MEDHKSTVREKVWSELRKVAYPDSRFHYDFGEFIADFSGSEEATQRLTVLECYKSAQTIFITPDNCLENLRLRSLQDGKKILMTTYAIRRGFWMLDPDDIHPSKFEYASTLDGMEKSARPLDLIEIKRSGIRVDLMVTGTGAINHKGVRFGKGHGFFDLEWGMLFTLGTVTLETKTVAFVHDFQVLEEELVPEEFDTVCDLVVTPTTIIEVTAAKKPTCGILWDRLAEGMLESIPPLQELRVLIRSGKIAQPNSREQVH